MEIRHLITQLGSERTVLLSTHVMQEVQRSCSRVVIIDRGKIIADDSVASLIASGRRGARVSVELEASAAEARGSLEALDSVAAVDTLELDAGEAHGSGGSACTIHREREGRAGSAQGDLRAGRGASVAPLGASPSAGEPGGPLPAAHRLKPGGGTGARG